MPVGWLPLNCALSIRRTDTAKQSSFYRVAFNGSVECMKPRKLKSIRIHVRLSACAMLVTTASMVYIGQQIFSYQTSR